MTMEDQLRALILKNHAGLLEQMATVGRLLNQTDKGGAVSPALITQAESITHQIKGAAGSIGFPEMGAAAAALDDNLKGLCKHGGAIPREELQAAWQLFATLERVAAESSPETSTLYNADLSQLAQ